jgi:hypothetical protein
MTYTTRYNTVYTNLKQTRKETTVTVYSAIINTQGNQATKHA